MTYDLNEAQEEQPSLSLEEMEKMWGAETDLLQRKVSGVYVKVCVTQNGVTVGDGTLTNLAPGINGYVLTSNGDGVPPSWKNVSGTGEIQIYNNASSAFAVQPSQILRDTSRRFLSSR
mgnify:CR=1 FL=1